MTQFDHPLPVGTVLEATDYEPPLYKFITEREVTAVGVRYMVYNSRSPPRKLLTQTDVDLDAVVGMDSFPDWTVAYCPDNDGA